MVVRSPVQWSDIPPTPEVALLADPPDGATVVETLVLPKPQEDYTQAAPAEEEDWENGGGRGWQRRGRRGRGGGGGDRRGTGGRRDGGLDRESEAAVWLQHGAPTAQCLEGDWVDSLGHAVTVEPPGGRGRRGPQTVRLARGGREQALSLRCDPATGAWACGNAVLDLLSSGPGCLVWAAHDGRRSVWRRRGGAEGGGPGEPPPEPPDLLPWLLVPPPAPPPAAPGPPPEPAERGEGAARRRNWGSIAEGDDDGEEEEEELRRCGEEGAGGEAAAPEAAAADAGPCEQAAGAGGRTEALAGQAAGGRREAEQRAERLAEDGARVAAILDVRQVLGNDRTAQEVLSYLLMDHDLLRPDGEDPMVPAPSSPLWERLPEAARRNALHRLGNFRVAHGAGCIPEAASSDFREFRCGRHRIPAADTDVQALLRRWTGPQDAPLRAACMAHVFSLYRTLESPLTPYWQRSSMQLSWDPVERNRSGVTHELFASPFNARVGNGRYASRWPHAEAVFGSAGSYPTVVETFPPTAILGVNPPFSEAYLEHLMGEMLNRLVQRFRRVHLTVPVREAPWRSQLQRLKGASFARQFWDSTAMMEKPLAHPVLYWEGSELGPPAS